jgi:hypothetical protein
VIQSGCQEFALHANRMQLAGHLFGSSGNSGARAMRIPVSDKDWVELSHHLGPIGYPAAVVPLANMMRLVLTDKSIHGAELEEQTAYFSTALFKAAASTAS